MKTGIQLIAEERVRQITKEGYTREHDDAHDHGELAISAAAYALHHTADGIVNVQDLWPFGSCEWKPKDYLSDLVRAGALIAAEIDRVQRVREMESRQLGGIPESDWNEYMNPEMANPEVDRKPETGNHEPWKAVVRVPIDVEEWLECPNGHGIWTRFPIGEKCPMPGCEKMGVVTDPPTITYP